MAVKHGKSYPLTVKIFSRSSKNGSIPIMISSVRELVSNGCDAITKLKKLEMMGEYTFPDDYKARDPSHLSIRKKRP